METNAVLLTEPGRIGLETLPLTPPGAGDVVVEMRHSGISTGTEKLFYTGAMPPFPGMGFPLVPGYEGLGEVVEAPRGAAVAVGDRVFVPGATCFEGAFGLFGAAASRVVTAADRLTRLDPEIGAEGALLALAATARHAIAPPHATPDLIVGHGTLGRLVARLCVAAGHVPTVWEVDPDRRDAADSSDEDSGAPARREYACRRDAYGDGGRVRDIRGRL
ncbi:MAG: alcohol dehydrogenase catalytic domain-containing protein, partial [Shimia sp.]